MTAPAESERPAGAAGPLEGVHVLIVEDVWIVAQSYVSLLEQLGVSVVGPAGTVTEALSLIAARQVDAALVDMNLHGEIATGVVDALASRGVPVVIVTGVEVSAELARKAAAFLSKPVRAHDLIGAFRSLGLTG